MRVASLPSTVKKVSGMNTGTNKSIVVNNIRTLLRLYKLMSIKTNEVGKCKTFLILKQYRYFDGFDSARCKSKENYRSNCMHTFDLSVKRSTTKIDMKQAKIFMERKLLCKQSLVHLTNFKTMYPASSLNTR